MPKIHSSIFEDNKGCIEFVKKKNRMKSRTNHIALKYHHFWEQVRKGSITVYYIDTKHWIAGIFTKALEPDQVAHLSQYLMEHKEVPNIYINMT